MFLGETACDPACLIALDFSVFIALNFEHPFARDDVFGVTLFNESPSLGVDKLVMFGVEGKAPVAAVNGGESLVHAGGGLARGQNKIDKTKRFAGG